MKPIKHVFRSVIHVSKFALLYLLLLILLTVLFGAVYAILGISSPIKYSIDVIWGTPVIPSNASYLSIAQKIVYDVFLVFLVGTFISQQMKPINPIEFSKYVAYNNEERHYSFRYWIVLPRTSYLFNPTVRVVVTDKAELIRGVNKLSSLFEKEEQYNSFRGVRYFRISGKEAEELTNALQSNDDLIISFIIVGCNADGTTYSSIQHYTKGDIRYGYEFVSIRESEYLKQAESLKGRLKKQKIKKSSVHKKDKLRFQHFDKLYSIRNKKEFIPIREKDVLSKKQIVFGEFLGPKQWIIDFLCTISANHLEYR